MNSKHILSTFLVATLAVSSIPFPVHAALINDINLAFNSVYGRDPSYAEWKYWADRVIRGEKKTYDALVGAMGFQKVKEGGASPTLSFGSTAPSSTTAPAGSFLTDPKLYPSTINPNFLPDGTLVTSPSTPNVYYIRNGKKSWVIPSVLNRWLGENHFYKQDVVITISDSDLNRYPQVASVNNLYIGKVLQAPNGTQYYIDDKLRKRELPANVRTALKFPSGNLYPTSSVHLQEFTTGPKITRTDVQPGGMVIYDGPYHGGRIWRIEENSAGKLTKRLFLSDYLYEAYGYPDESQRVAASAVDLAKYPRGANIERYPDGWVVGISGTIYVVQNETLRRIASPAVFTALGYNQKYILTVFPEFLKRYPQAQPIGAFKTVIASGVTASATNITAAPNISQNLQKVRPAIRSLIGEINSIYISVFDKDVSVSENQFWVNYVYNGEVNNKADLIAAMQRTKTTGKKPALTSRTAVLSESTLENKWFPYLFYFVWQLEPSSADRNYWFDRIRPGDRDTIEKLGGTLQWLKETSGVTHK